MSLDFLPSIFVPIFCLVLPLVALRSFFSYISKSIVD